LLSEFMKYHWMLFYKYDSTELQTSLSFIEMQQ